MALSSTFCHPATLSIIYTPKDFHKSYCNILRLIFFKVDIFSVISHIENSQITFFKLIFFNSKILKLKSSDLKIYMLEIYSLFYMLKTLMLIQVFQVDTSNYCQIIFLTVFKQRTTIPVSNANSQSLSLLLSSIYTPRP
jgi:cellulose synthase/poly-beta-1,6-N-acetylglucosamine synthase-like glycosyltransferase